MGRCLTRRKLVAAMVIALRRTKITGLYAAKIDDEFLQYNSWVDHPEFQNVIPRS